MVTAKLVDSVRYIFRLAIELASCRLVFGRGVFKVALLVLNILCFRVLLCGCSF